eukprot:TRINITY_DN19366_c0_g1_i1.p1 TRINITY_DN19366_c0_g1~~TRINITY_DN19366_c0_g1_i1.p1  ORF type:complete len:354 (+),score=101.33 TRINITY_DN19366_c0_g1_i1:67-1128(+)
MAGIRSAAFATLASTAAAAGGFSFLTVGDWGGATLGGYHEANQKAVAAQMGKTAEDLGAKFIINTGDNFYYCGVKTITDDQWKTDFEDVFTADSLSVPWYGVLGNHDYAYEVAPQLQYKSPNKDRWVMPDRNYTKRIQLSGDQYLTLVFIDSNPCIQNYRNDNPKDWDPCSGEYGECKDNPDNECHFHAHILSQDCSGQYDWLESTLNNVPKDDWLIAVGHHEADQINVEDMTGLLQKRGINMYFNGHTHALKHYQLDGDTNIDWVTSGAGCMVHSHDQDVEVGAAEKKDHDVKEVWYKAISGFTAHTFSEDFSTLSTQILDTDGNVLHSFKTYKKGGKQTTAVADEKTSVVV